MMTSVSKAPCKQLFMIHLHAEGHILLYHYWLVISDEKYQSTKHPK